MSLAHCDTIEPTFYARFLDRFPRLVSLSLCHTVVDNSALGRKAMAEGRPPYVIDVYSKKHHKRKNGRYGKLGDRVLLAVLGQKKKGIIVGMKAKQLPGIPRLVVGS